MTRYLTTFFLLAVLGLSMPAGAEPADPDHGDHVSVLDGVRAIHAWTRETAATDTLVFVEIENTSNREVRLIGGDAELADSVTLVGFKMTDGEPTYVALPPVTIKPSRDLVLAPRGIALRLDGLEAPLREGETFEMELVLDTGHLDVHVSVEDEKATQHGHAGHAN